MTFLEVVVSPEILRLLRRLHAGLPERELSGLRPRQRQLVRRLEASRFVIRQGAGAASVLKLSAGAAFDIAKPVARERMHSVTRAHLDRLGLPLIPPFTIRALRKVGDSWAKPNGRPSPPGPRVYLRRVPAEFDPTTDLDEIALALLVLDPAACRAFLRSHSVDRGRLRERLRDEDLATRAFHFGIHKLIGMKRSARSDAVRRASTEPIR